MLTVSSDPLLHLVEALHCSGILATATADYFLSSLKDIYQIDSLMSVPYDFLTAGHKAW